MMNAAAGAAMPTKDDPDISTYMIDFPTPDWQHMKALAALRGQSINDFLNATIRKAVAAARRGDAPKPKKSKKASEPSTATGTLTPRKLASGRKTTPYVLKYPADGWRQVKSIAALHADSMRAFIQNAVYAELEEADKSGELRVRVTR